MSETIGDPKIQLIFIYHISRCGSTLLKQVSLWCCCNALLTFSGLTVISKIDPWDPVGIMSSSGFPVFIYHPHEGWKAVLTRWPVESAFQLRTEGSTSLTVTSLKRPWLDQAVSCTSPRSECMNIWTGVSLRLVSNPSITIHIYIY